jgi:hypothetical protein
MNARNVVTGSLLCLSTAGLGKQLKAQAPEAQGAVPTPVERMEAPPLAKAPRFVRVPPEPGPMLGLKTANTRSIVAAEVGHTFEGGATPAAHLGIRSAGIALGKRVHLDYGNWSDRLELEPQLSLSHQRGKGQYLGGAVAVRHFDGWHGSEAGVGIQLGYHRRLAGSGPKNLFEVGISLRSYR